MIIFDLQIDHQARDEELGAKQNQEDGKGSESRIGEVVAQNPTVIKHAKAGDEAQKNDK